MRWLNGYKMEAVVVGVVVALMLVGDRCANAEIVMGEPSSVGPVINDATDVQNSDFSHDGLELYYSSARPGGYGSYDIWVSQRETLNNPWQEPINLGPNVNSQRHEAEPSISSDGLELYFSSWDDWILRVCTRPSKDAPWGSPVKIGPPIGYDASSPDISADGLSLYFASVRSGGYGNCDVWVATRATKDDLWSEPVNLGPNVNTASNEWAVSISADARTLVFSREFRTMWATTRQTIDDDWGPSIILPFDNPPGNFHSPTLSPDGSTLYFNAAGGWGTLGANDIWQVKFIPIVDFNSDEIVDIADLLILIEHWGEENPSLDIGPLPMGDGMVDGADLKVLMSYWGQEVLPLELVAYWKLDETEGDIAYDSARTKDAAVFGDPVWQPESGIVDGAIALDGIDDYIETPFVLNPVDGEFSVFAWIKSGASGQAILSQADSSNWLCLDSVEGCLTTELKGSGRSPGGTLSSEVVIADGTWHRIGLVWDGSYRCLYVDGVEVAKDTNPLSNLENAEGGLYFGVDCTLAPGTFFSGLIDDIRIYNRVISP